MKKAVVIGQEDIKKLLAEKFHVPEKNVVRAQYSYTVIIEEEAAEEWQKA